VCVRRFHFLPVQLLHLSVQIRGRGAGGGRRLPRSGARPRGRAIQKLNGLARKGTGQVSVRGRGRRGHRLVRDPDSMMRGVPVADAVQDGYRFPHCGRSDADFLDGTGERWPQLEAPLIFRRRRGEYTRHPVGPKAGEQLRVDSLGDGTACRRAQRRDGIRHEQDGILCAASFVQNCPGALRHVPRTAPVRPQVAYRNMKHAPVP
jgi:hypothetical protein